MFIEESLGGCASVLLHPGVPCHFCTPRVALAAAIVIVLSSDVSMVVMVYKQAAFPGKGAPPAGPPSPTSAHSFSRGILTFTLQGQQYLLGWEATHYLTCKKTSAAGLAKLERLSFHLP